MTVDIREASDLFWTAWQQRAVIDEVPAALRPRTRAEGYAIQAVLDLRSSARPAGWKIAATSAAGQRHINVGGPMAGRILTERIFDDGAVVSLAGVRMRVAEPEFVFVVGDTIAPRAQPYRREEVMSHVADLRLGIEVPDSRFASFTTVGEALLIADNACANDYVLGPVVNSPWRNANLAEHQVVATVKGLARSYSREGVGGNVLGDPIIALEWLVNELSSHGFTLYADQFVTTGTCMVPLEVEPGDAVSVDYGDFGRVRCEFA